MSNKLTDVDIKNRTYYFFDDMINIKNCWSRWNKDRWKAIQKYSSLLYWIRDVLAS